LNPLFISGFADAEGSFNVSITPFSENKIKWRVSPRFTIGLHSKDITILEQIKDTLGIGTVSKISGKMVYYTVSSIKDLAVIIDHF
jgi:hypothetical protein